VVAVTTPDNVRMLEVFRTKLHIKTNLHEKNVESTKKMSLEPEGSRAECKVVRVNGYDTTDNKR